MGTVTASRPPGRSTRTSSAIASRVGPQVFEHLRRDDPVERRVGERQAERVAVDLAAGRVGGDLAGLDHRTAGGAHFLQLAGVVVEGDDRRAAPHRRERVPPAAATHVEEALTGAQVEAVEVDGEHQAAPPPRASSRAR